MPNGDISKKELLNFIKEHKGDSPNANLILKLMRSFADQCDADERITFKNFLLYLKKNILVVTRRDLIDSTTDDITIFSQLMAPIKGALTCYDTDQQKKWENPWKNAKTTDEETILHKIAYKNDLSFLEYLVNEGADINIRSRRGYTPFMGLIFGCKLMGRPIDQIENAIQAMLELGADIHCKNDYNWTALDCAIIVNDINWVKVLLKHGVQFRKDCSEKAIRLLLEQARSFCPPKLIFSSTSCIKESTSINISDLVSIIISYLPKKYKTKTYGYFFQKNQDSPLKQLFLEENEKPQETQSSMCRIQ